MDRFTSSGTERPIFVDEQYILAQLPVKEAFFQMEITAPTEDLEGRVPNPVQDGAGQVSDARANMGVAAYTIRLVAIWGKIIHSLKGHGTRFKTLHIPAKSGRNSYTLTSAKAYLSS